MVFSSHLFVYYFLPAALALYYLSPARLRNLVLTLTSFVFYGWANPAFGLLLSATTIVDYVCGLMLTGGLRRPWRGSLPVLEPGGARSPTQKAALWISIVTNLSLLGFFKYFNFGVDSYNAAASALGLGDWRLETTLRVALPVGISFFTFQYMSYVIDVYRGHAQAVRNIVDFFTFESMFPQLVAGPIIRYSEVDEQLRARTHTAEKFARGVAFFSLGMAKKVLLANPCGFVADAAFGAGSLGALDAWTGVLAYAFQIYFDFSGYSDMAIGLGLMLGFVFPKNFDSPYRAESLTDFWRRWHISLSTWLRDYLYVPLGGSRKGPRRTYVNLFIVMLLGGLWHGAAWTFVVWGAVHGAWLALERALGKRSPYAWLPRPLRVCLTFAGVLVTWVFFRAPDLTAAMRYLEGMAGLSDAPPASALLASILYTPHALLSLGAAAIVTWLCPQTWDWSRRLTWPRGAAAFGCLVTALVAMASQGYNPFIYFIF
jgi:alginate O-acetyltransferase complex protein AlgI